MKHILSILFVLFVFSTAFGQAKKRGKVKRKYRNVETVARKLQPVYLSGTIYDADKNPIAGARVTIDGTKKTVHTNVFGEFLIKNLQTGKARIRVVFAGYKIKTTDIILRAGENYKKIMLAEERFHFEPEMVSTQKREQQIMDVPLAVTAVTAKTMEQSNITGLNQLGEFVPGLLVSGYTNQAEFTIRGITNNNMWLSSQPRVAVFNNSVPVNREGAASVELFDLERVEVLKGPQNTLWGRGAQAGAIRFISKNPDNYFGGYITAGGGNFAQKEVRAAVNIPVIEDMLFVRAAGIYNARDGFVTNTFGGTLNGKENFGGRFSVRFLPAWNHQIDLVFNYQKSDAPGVAFMSKIYPNTNGKTGVFSGTASLNEGGKLTSATDFYDATLNYKYYFSEHIYLSSISSYSSGNSSALIDGDGTAAQAINLQKNGKAEQFFQEIRLNFSRNSRMNGSMGATYLHEKADQKLGFATNEQHTANLFLDPVNLVASSGQPVVIETLPDIPEMGPAAGMSLPENHEEEKLNRATNQSVEAFLDFTYQFLRKVYLSGGVRGMFDTYKYSNRAVFSGGSISTLGMITGNVPNLIFPLAETTQINKNTISVTGHAGLQVKISDEATVFVNYARGRRPNVLQFNNSGDEENVDAEILNNYEGGFKTSFLSRIFVDATGFYQQYKNFQTGEWVLDSTSPKYIYQTVNGGKATLWGAEVNAQVAVIKQLTVFGNYAWLHSVFDSTNVAGEKQKYAGNRLRLSPEHSFTFGLNARVNITPTIQLFVTPSYSFKTDFYFDNANSENLKQNAYGLLNINGGLELAEPNVIFSVYGTNLLDEQFVTSAGHSGSMFGITTFVPGEPRMFGAKLMWKF